MMTAVAVAVAVAIPATAATPPVGSFPDFQKTAPGEFTAYFSDYTGFPDVSISTDNAGAAIASGKSAFLGASTGFGKQFGSSRQQPYITIASLGQDADDFSTTTLTFAESTPAGWGIAFGDVDADYVTMTATGPGGAVTPEQFGAQDSMAGDDFLNYCRDASPKPGTCSAAQAPYDDYPELCGTGSTYPLCASLPPGSISAVGHGADTAGSYDWFVPTVPIDEITLTFTPLAGSPNFQLWLVAPSPAATVTAALELGDGEQPIPPGTRVELLDDAGAPVTDIEGDPVVVEVAPDGSFSLVTEFGDYRLDLDLPADVAPADPDDFPLEFTADSDVVDLGTFAIAAAPGDPGDAGGPGGTPRLVETGVDPIVPLGVASILLIAGSAVIVRRRATA